MAPAEDTSIVPRAITACVAGTLTACFLILYLLTTHYDVTMDAGDAAQFQTIGVVGGIPHQPYPFYCILSNCFARLPMGEPAFRVTLLSVVCAALTVGLLFVLIVGITRDVIASAIAGAAFGLSHAFWQAAVVAEVYAPGTLLFVVFLLLLLRLLRTGSRSTWFMLVLTVGFLVSHHQLNIAVFPALAFVLYRQRGRLAGYLSRRDVAVGAALFLLPFTLYLYTYIVAGNPNALNWYENQGRYLYADRGFDPAAFAHFWEKLRFQMWPARYGDILQTPVGFARQTVYWVRHLVSLEYPFLGSLVIVAGFLSLWRAERELRVFWLVLIVAYAGLALNYLSGGALTYTYSIPIYLVLAIYLAHGVSRFRRSVARYKRISVVAIAALAVLLVALPVLRHGRTSPFARFLRSPGGILEIEQGEGFFWHLIASGTKGREYGESVANTVAPNSLIFAKWAEANVLLYHKLVSGLLQEVDVHYVLPRRAYMVNLIREKKPDEVYFAFRPDSLGFTTVETVRVEPARRLYRVDVTQIFSAD
ncbi:MAG: DUF2723 domain-containing protein [Candidatus Krumholzibacteria bacterium]